MRLPLLVLLLLAAATAQAEDLLDIYRQAQQNDPQWSAAKSARTAGIERADQGRAQMYPTVGLSAATSQSNQHVVTPSVDTTYDYRTDSYSLNASQPLWRRQNMASYAQGDAVAAQAEHEFASASQDLMVRVTQTYLSVLSAQDARDFARAEKASFERLAAISQRNFSAGTANLVDVHETRAASDLAAAQEIAAENELDVRREALRVLTAASPATLARLSRPLQLEPPQPADPAHWAALSAQTPQVRRDEQALEIAQQELEKARGGHQPTLDLTASHSYSDAGGSTQGIAIETRTNQVGLVFQMPLYAGGAVSSRVRETAARRDEAEQRLEASRRQAAQQARAQYLAVVSGATRVRALEQAEQSQRRALDTTLLGYERGLRTASDVVRNQRDLYRTQRDLSQARYDYLLSQLRLKAAVGTLVEDDLVAVNALLAYP